MAPNLDRITAALNAYPWMAGALTAPGSAGPRYCAIGMLLRYAGVAREELSCARPVTDVWLRHRALLASEYGIGDCMTAMAIVAANDGADSHAEAIARVQAAVTGGLAGRPVVPLEDRAEPEEEGGSLVVVG